MPPSRFEILLRQHDLPPSLIYLAPVLPIVQVMWADGRNQIPERAKLHLIMQNHCEALNELANGVQVVSKKDVEMFDQTFIAERPDSNMMEAFMDELRDLMKSRSSGASAGVDSLYERDRLFHACLEIAATCPASLGDCSGEMFAQRIVEEERRYIEQVLELFPDPT